MHCRTVQGIRSIYGSAELCGFSYRAKFKKMATITFWERTIGANFPPYMSSITLKNENVQNAKNWTPFEQDGLKFDFDDSVHANGCWATKPGEPGQCKVYIDFSA
jgi:hypothetical protein